LKKNERRYVIFAAVAGAHAFVIGILLSGSRASRIVVPGGAPLTAMILMPVRAHRRPPLPPSRGALQPWRIAPLVEPITLPATSVPVRITARPRIDWASAARHAVSSVLRARRVMAFGFPRGARAATSLRSASSPVRAGDSYRTSTGGHVASVSRSCYAVSDPPAPGEPFFLQQAQLPRITCKGRAAPAAGELFKSLSAYKKLRALPARRTSPPR
jgi:hypothetical protein